MEENRRTKRIYAICVAPALTIGHDHVVVERDSLNSVQKKAEVTHMRKS